MANPIKSALTAARDYQSARYQYLRWRAGKAVDFWYRSAPGPGPVQHRFQASADPARPQKLRLLQMIDLIYVKLSGDWSNIEGLPSAQEFNTRLDPAKSKEIREHLGFFHADRSQGASQLTRILESREFLEHFEQLSSLRKIDVLTEVVPGLAETQVGRNFLRGATRSGESPPRLLDPERLKALPFHLFEVGTEAQPSLAVDPQVVAEAKTLFSTANAESAVKHVVTLYELFTTSVIPLAIHGRQELSGVGDPQIAEMADAVLAAVLPDTVVNPSASPEDKRAGAVAYIEDNETSFRQFADSAFRMLSVLINVYDAFISLDKLAKKPTLEVVDGAEAVNAIAKIVTAAALLMEEESAKLAARAVAGAAIFLLVVDGVVAFKGFADAGDVGDRSVQAGHALKFTGAAIGAGGAVYSAFILGGSALGPVGLVAAGIGIALILLGEALITFTSNPPLENFAATCWFSKEPAGTNEPKDIHYGFFKIVDNAPDPEQPDLNVQLDRLYTMLQPLGFKMDVNTTAATLSFDRFEQGDQALPDGTVLMLAMLGGQSHPANVTQSSFDQLQNIGSVGVPAFPEELHGHWVQLEARLPVSKAVVQMLGADSEEVRGKHLIEYQKIEV